MRINETLSLICVVLSGLVASVTMEPQEDADLLRGRNLLGKDSIDDSGEGEGSFCFQRLDACRYEVEEAKRKKYWRSARFLQESDDDDRLWHWKKREAKEEKGPLKKTLTTTQDKCQDQVKACQEELHVWSICIANESSLRNSIRKTKRELDNGSSDSPPATIVLCPSIAIFVTGSPIDLIDTSFEMTCGRLLAKKNRDEEENNVRRVLQKREKLDTEGPCMITGQGSTRLFAGRPIQATFRGITFQNGYAATEIDEFDELGGGALYLTGGRTMVENCTFIGNVASLGGAVYTTETATYLTVRHSTFHSNRATDSGGAIAVTWSTVSISNSKFDNNLAGKSGGAMYIQGRVMVKHSFFQSNTAGLHGGALSVVDDNYGSDAELEHLVYEKNSAGLHGDNVHVYDRQRGSVTE
jgi:predicted outer membrane repeat protein